MKKIQVTAITKGSMVMLEYLGADWFFDGDDGECLKILEKDDDTTSDVAQIYENDDFKIVSVALESIDKNQIVPENANKTAGIISGKVISLYPEPGKNLDI